MNLPLSPVIKTMIQQLQQNGPPPDGVAQLCETPGGALTAYVQQAGPLACAVAALELRDARLEGASSDRLAAIASELVASVNYLLEPLAIIESDAAAGTVQLRSAAPQRTSHGVAYYELKIDQQRLRLSRLLNPRGAATRSECPMVFTYETLERLSQNLTAAVD